MIYNPFKARVGRQRQNSAVCDTEQCRIPHSVNQCRIFGNSFLTKYLIKNILIQCRSKHRLYVLNLFISEGQRVKEGEMGGGGREEMGGGRGGGGRGEGGGG